MSAFRIAMIGAGETGTPLLKQMLSCDFVDVLGVADLDFNQPGITLAKEHGVFVTQDFMELAALGEEVDILIDVTGASMVRESLRYHMIETQNNHTLIMHERVALFLMSLSCGKLVSPKHDDLEYI